MPVTTVDSDNTAVNKTDKILVLKKLIVYVCVCDGEGKNVRWLLN